MSTTPFLLFIENADEYDRILLRQFVKDRLGSRARLCTAENVYDSTPGDNPRARPRLIGQRAVRVL